MEERDASSSTPTARGNTKNEVVEAKSLDEELLSFVTGAEGDTQVSSVPNQEKSGHKNALIVQVVFMNWIQSYPMKTKETSETMSCLERFFSLSQKPKRIDTDNSKEFIKACQDLQWNRDTSTTHRSETNGVAKRAVRRVKEGTAVALVQSALPEEWWVCVMERRCSLRNVHDKVADVKTAFEKRLGKTIDGPSIPCGTLVEHIPVTAKDKSRVHQFGKTTLK